MIEFALPIAVLPAVALPFLLRRKTQNSALISSVEVVSSVRSTFRSRSRSIVLGALAVMSVVALAIAGSGPYEEEVITEQEERRNIMLTLDVSGSMRAQDIPGASQRASRMDAVKHVVQDFISQRGADRLGLVVFGSHAYLQSPLTIDHELLVAFVKDLVAGMAGEGTALGDGLGVSIKHISHLPGASRAVILLTDGVNNSGTANPIDAAHVAKELGIKVHVVGVGGAGRGGAEYDEETLKRIASMTGGVFFNARSVADLERVYQEIDALERSEEEHETIARLSLSGLPLLCGALAFSALHILSRSFYLRVP